MYSTINRQHNTMAVVRITGMAKYKKLEESVFVVKCDLINSRYGGEVYDVRLKGVNSQEDYKTYVDPQNANFEIWSEIVQAAETHGVVLKNVKLKDPNNNLINADSSVKCVITTKEQLADLIAELWNKQTPPTLFDSV